MSGRQGFITNHQTYIYQESPSTGPTDLCSAALGLDNSATPIWRLLVKADDTAYIFTSGQLSIDPSTNGNITLDPNGSGNVVITSGSVSLTAGNLALPVTSSTVGQVIIGGERLFHVYDANTPKANIFLGRDAGNFTLTGTNNTVCGYHSGADLAAGGSNSLYGVVCGLKLTDAEYCVAMGRFSLANNLLGSWNTSIGSNTLNALVNSSAAGGNTALGGNALKAVVTGTYNIGIGCMSTSTGGGSALTTSDSGNIMIGHVGVAGDNAATRIGTSQTTFYAAGIYGVTPGGTLNLALVNNSGQLGSVAALGVANGGTGAATFTDHGVLIGNAANAISATAEGATGVILTGVTGNPPAWTTATYPATIAKGEILAASAANTITALTAGTADYVLTAHGAGNAVTWEAAAGGGIGTLADGVGGTATGGTVTVAGGAGCTTSAATATLTIDVDKAQIAMTSVDFANAGRIGTGTTAADTLLLRAYDVDGTAYTTFATLTANNTPTMDLATTVTMGTNAIYYATGTDVPVTDGGTGASTFTQYGIIYGNATSALQVTAAGTTGQILVGNTGSAPTWAAAPGGGLTWSVVTSDLNPMVVDNGYIANKAGLLTFTLPTTCAAGKVLRVTGMNTAVGWRIAQSANQIIHFGTSTTTTGAGGYIEATNIHDSVELVCCVADLEFIVVSSTGNLTIA